MNTLKNIFAPRVFSGWHMFGVIALFFGTIISINIVLAFNAAGTWTGLVVKNTYIESQNFNSRVADLNAHKPLGWKIAISYNSDQLKISAHDNTDTFIKSAVVSGYLGKPVHEHDDQTIIFGEANGAYVSEVSLSDGLWQIQLQIIDSKGLTFVETKRFTITNGVGN
ncbi:FixH family protein [Ahrensia kielensis]|uniref:FixH family protein n=1 Tax=Ahrensia kielensis TaxID=76980 RepID=UPI0003810E58|nr:FixH family protein [Ahrensia kielensis]